MVNGLISRVTTVCLVGSFGLGQYREGLLLVTLNWSDHHRQVNGVSSVHGIFVSDVIGQLSADVIVGKNSNTGWLVVVSFKFSVLKLVLIMS